jgi:flagellar assembly protein FliH
MRSIEATSISWLDVFKEPSKDARFVPWGDAAEPAEDDLPADIPEAFEPEGEPIDEIAALRAECFAQGFEEGRRTVELEVAAEREALARLAESLSAIRPEPPQVLAALLAETVDRLVRQVVGEAGVDAELLRSRAVAAAALVGAETEPGRMLVHPDDVPLLSGARLPLPVAGDPTLARGSVVIECGKGWIEDGPAVRLDRLRNALDRLGVPR